MIQRSVAPCLLREQANVEAQQTVGAHLQQHAGQQNRAGGRRFDVRVRQPGVQREQRHLHREGDEEAEKEPLRGVAKPAPRRSASAL